MPITCSAENLAEQSKCLVEKLSRVELKAARIYLLCSYINGTTVDCDAQTLATASACILEKMSSGDMDAAETWLTCQIAGGSAGAGGQLVIYTSGTPANPTNTALPAIAYDPTGNLPTLGWNTGTLAWG